MVPPGPSGRGNSSVTAIGSDIVILFGGFYYPDSTHSTFYNDIWAYNIPNQTWLQLSDQNGPSARNGHSAVNIGQQVLLFGGYTQNYLSNGGFSNELWLYDFSDQTWYQPSQGDYGSPDPRAYHVAGVSDTFMLIFGGNTPSAGFVNDLWQYDLNTHNWSDLYPENPPSRRAYHAGLMVGQDFYIFGGSPDDSTLLSDFWKYNLPTNTWTQLTGVTSPPGRVNASLAAGSNNTILLFGGSTDATQNDTSTNTLNDCWIYDLTIHTWYQQSVVIPPRQSYAITTAGSAIVLFGGFQQGPTNPLSDIWILYPQFQALQYTDQQLIPTNSGPQERGGLSLVSFNSSVILFGGYNSSVTFNDTWMFDLNSNTWRSDTTFNSPTGRYAHSGTVVDGKMLVFGGHSGTGFLNDLWTYDPSNPTWTLSAAAGPSARQAHVASAVGDNLIIFGGYNGAYLNDLWQYDVLSDAWMPLSDLNGPSPRKDAASTTIDSAFFVFGGIGQNNTVLFDFWQYDTSVQSWVQLPNINHPPARAAHSIIATDNKILLFGGTSDVNYSSVLNDLWEYDVITQVWTLLSDNLDVCGRQGFGCTSVGSDIILYGGFQQGGLSSTPLSDIWQLSPVYVDNIPVINTLPNQTQTYLSATGINNLSDAGIYFPNLIGMNNDRQYTSSAQITLSDIMQLGTYSYAYSDQCSVQLNFPQSDVTAFPGSMFFVNCTIQTSFGQDLSNVTIDFNGQTSNSDYRGSQQSFILTAPQTFSNVQTIRSSDQSDLILDFDLNFAVTPIQIDITLVGSDYTISDTSQSVISGPGKSISIPFSDTGSFTYTVTATNPNNQNTLGSITGLISDFQIVQISPIGPQQISISAQNILYTHASDSVQLPFSYAYPTIAISDLSYSSDSIANSIFNVSCSFPLQTVSDIYQMILTLGERTVSQIFSTSDQPSIGIATPSDAGVYSGSLTILGVNSPTLVNTIPFNVTVDNASITQPSYTLS